MQRTRIVTLLFAAAVLVPLTTAVPHALALRETRGDAPTGDGCATVSPGSEWHYVVAARIRPLLFWTGWKEVGDARIRRSETDSTRHLELLIGTDPERAPLKLNRWGYVAETACGPTTEIVGVMTVSDEETIEEATAYISQGSNARHAFRAIRGNLAGGEAATEVLRLGFTENFTYRHLDVLLQRLPPPGTPRRATVLPGAHAGFLTAVSAVLQQEQADYQRSGQLTPIPAQVFVFGGRLYDLRLKSAKVGPDVQLGSRTFRGPIENEFEVRNRTTQHTSRFRIACCAEQGLAAVPLRVVYQPRWWLQIELRLRDAAGFHSSQP